MGAQSPLLEHRNQEEKSPRSWAAHSFLQSSCAETYVLQRKRTNSTAAITGTFLGCPQFSRRLTSQVHPSGVPSSPFHLSRWWWSPQPELESAKRCTSGCVSPFLERLKWGEKSHPAWALLDWRERGTSISHCSPTVESMWPALERWREEAPWCSLASQLYATGSVFLVLMGTAPSNLRQN